MPQAVIKTGGKQYFVSDGDVIRVEKLPEEEGKNVTFKDVLLTTIRNKTTVGTPLVQGAKVEGKVVKHGRHKKVTGVKMKAKKRHKKYFGHKQHYTEVSITKITTAK